MPPSSFSDEYATVNCLDLEWSKFINCHESCTYFVYMRFNINFNLGSCAKPSSNLLMAVG